MSFTEDELEAFNTILERRLAAQQREMERSFERYLIAFRRDIEQRFITVQQEIVRNLTLKLTELQSGLDTILSQRLNTQQAHITQTISSAFEQHRQQDEGNLDQMLAAQLLGIEQLLSQQLAQYLPNALQTEGTFPPLDAIEVQTELPWEDLVNVIGRALDERLTILQQSMQRAIENLAQDLTARLYSTHNESSRRQMHLRDADTSNTQEILREIEHLQRIVESIQVVMSSNQALLSNRLYHHQQLPLEQAHPSGQLSSNGLNTPPALEQEHFVEDREETEEV